MRPLPVGDLGAPAQGDVVVASAHQKGPVSRRLVEPGGQLAGDRQRDALFIDLVGPDGARVLPAMAGVYGDDHGPQAIRLGGLGNRRFGGPLIKEVDHQAVAVRRDGRQLEVLAGDRHSQIQHHAVGALPGAPAHVLDPPAQAAGDVRVEARRRAGVAQVDDQPVGIAQGEDAGLDGGRGVEHHSGVVRRFVGADVMQRLGVDQCPRRQQECQRRAERPGVPDRGTRPSHEPARAPGGWPVVGLGPRRVRHGLAPAGRRPQCAARG